MASTSAGEAPSSRQCTENENQSSPSRPVAAWGFYRACQHWTCPWLTQSWHGTRRSHRHSLGSIRQSSRSYQRSSPLRGCTFLRVLLSTAYRRVSVSCAQACQCRTTHFSLAGSALSLLSLPTSEVGFDGPALEAAISPSSPRRIIFLGCTVGGGVPLLGVAATMLARDGGTRQNGVRKMRTLLVACSYECVM